jgi:hypothetical protein
MAAKIQNGHQIGNSMQKRSNVPKLWENRPNQANRRHVWVKTDKSGQSIAIPGGA